MKSYIFYYFIILFIILNLFNVSALSVTVHVPEKYSDISAGERFYFEIEVKYPENPKRKDLRLEYEIITIDGELIVKAKALKAIETQISFIDFIIIPDNTASGLHLINIKIKDYDDLSEEVSSSFQIVGNTANQIKIYFFILFGIVIFIGGLIIFGLIKRK